MRPLHLEMTGFAAFREQAIVDFQQHELLALSGPTGAGKSSIIDGITFALYGSVSRYGNEKLIAPIINTLSTEARVRLDFSIGDEHYAAVRVVRRTATGASTKEARLEHLDSVGDGESTVLAGTAVEVTTEVEALLGLSFGQFTKTIVLPQGDFARFLTETAGDRQALLRRLLGLDVYAAMGRTARSRSSKATIEADATRQALGNIEIVTEAALARLTKAAAKLDDAAAAANETHAQLVEASAAYNVTTAELSDVDEALAELSEIAIPEDAQAYATDVAAADKAITSLQKQFDAAEAKRLKALDAIDALTPAEDIDAGLELRDRADELSRSCIDLDAAAAADAAAHTEATDTVSTIEERLRQARDELEHTRIAAGAAGIASTLSLGDDCPVCARTIDVLPETHDHDVSHLESLVSQAEEAALQARKTVADASTQATSSEVAAGTARQSLQELTDQLTQVPTRSQLTAAAKKLATATTKLETASAEATELIVQLEAASEDRTALTDRVSELRRNFVEIRDSIAMLDPPVPTNDDVFANWRELTEWSTDKTKTLVADRKSLIAQQKVDEKAVSALQKQMAKHVKPFGIDIDQSAEQLHLALTAERDAAVAARDDAAFRQKRDATNAERIIELEEEAIVTAELGRLLNAKGFEQWLMTDVMIDLAERATERLMVLSSGAYSLTTDGTDFAVLDHRNADEVRSARTLSGGETFLASLALALSLADSITDVASTAIAPTESVFLDEGFGTLDGETLDVVANAIEELGAQGRLVVIVTHISELADRLPHHVRVLRGPTGSTVTQGIGALS